MNSSRLETKPKIWAYVIISGIIFYLAIDILLAHLRPSYSLLHNAESDYGRGPYFWLMDINFLLRGAFSLVLVKVIWDAFPEDIIAKRASYWLASWAITSGLLAFFADNPYSYLHLWTGSIHLLLAFVAFLSILVGMFLLNRQLRQVSAWSAVTKLLTIISIIAVISVLLIGRSGFKPHGLGGLYERIFLGSVLVWEGIVALSLGSTPTSKIK